METLLNRFHFLITAIDPQNLHGILPVCLPHLPIQIVPETMFAQIRLD